MHYKQAQSDALRDVLLAFTVFLVVGHLVEHQQLQLIEFDTQ